MALIKILPEFVPRPWGCRTLAPLFEMPSGVSDPIGEVWLTSMDCRVALTDSKEPTGTLGEFWSQLLAVERGSSTEGFERFPLLLKFIFTAEKLSVQVHPGDKYAQQNEDEPWGKTEAWHILHAEPDAWVKVGFQDGVSSDQVEAAWGKPEMEGLLNHLPVATGDTVFVPAGTVHAIGPGLCLCEIQQYSDVTYRVYDYGRLGLDGNPRQLHLEKARAVANLKAVSAGRLSSFSVEAMGRLVANPYFAIRDCQFGGSFKVAPNSESFDVFVICDGNGTARNEGRKWNFRPGDTYLRTSNDSEVVIEGKGFTKVLHLSPRSTTAK